MAKRKGRKPTPLQAAFIIKWKDFPAWREKMLKNLRRPLTAKDMMVTINCRDYDLPAPESRDTGRSSGRAKAGRRAR